jgi:L-amino acid N-acyltransferase YncA
MAAFFRLRPDQVYVHDIYTVPEWRRRGVTRDLMIESNRQLLALGYRELFSLQELDNHDAIATMRANGIHHIGMLTRTCLLFHVAFSFDPSYAGPQPASLS